jgi:dienelactone hydrolase
VIPSVGGTALRRLLDLPAAPTPAALLNVPSDAAAHPISFASLPYLGRPTTVFAYVALPLRGDAPVPAVVLVHGGEGTAFAEWAALWATRGYAAIAVDLGGRRADGTRDFASGPDHDDLTKFISLADGVENSWPFHAVGAVLGGIAILRSMPNVDRNAIFLTGISWGAIVSELTASLDPGIAGACFVYGCGNLAENPVLGEHLADLTLELRATWLREFDPADHLPRVTIPTLWVTGARDEYFPLGLFENSVETVTGPVTVRITSDMAHGHEEGWAPNEIWTYFEELRSHASGLAQLAKPYVDGNRLRCRALGAPIASVELWTTQNSGAWSGRAWTSSAAVNEDGALQADVVLGATAAFFTATTTSGALSSSPLLDFG